MNKLMPTVFIGSSMEGKAIADKIQGELADVFECKIWCYQFELGNSAYEDLVSKLSLYDYGILIATADDILVSRKIKKLSARDNILFEFGLFVGRLGRSRAFLVVEDGAKIPSDLQGITLAFFSSIKAKGFFGLFNSAKNLELKQNDEIAKICEKIRDQILRREALSDFGLLPSTALAYGYFQNFVLKAVSNLLDTKVLRLEPESETLAAHYGKEDEGVRFENLSFVILIPDELKADMFDHVKAQRIKNNWKLLKINAGGFRPFDFYIEVEKSTRGTLLLSDVPITLNALNQAIEAYIGKSYLGISEAEKLLEKRELRNFKKTLDFLISTNPLTKDRVKTELVDI